jgi:hypothetical protein
MLIASSRWKFPGHSGWFSRMHTGVMVLIDYSRYLVRLLTYLQGFRRMLKRNAPSRLSISQNYLETFPVPCQDSIFTSLSAPRR